MKFSTGQRAGSVSRRHGPCCLACWTRWPRSDPTCRPTILPYIGQSQVVAPVLWRRKSRFGGPGVGRRSYNGVSAGWAQPVDSPAGAFAKRSAGWVGSTEIQGVVQGLPPDASRRREEACMFDENSDIDDLVCRVGTPVRVPEQYVA